MSSSFIFKGHIRFVFLKASGGSAGFNTQAHTISLSRSFLVLYLGLLLSVAFKIIIHFPIKDLNSIGKTFISNLDAVVNIWLFYASGYVAKWIEWSDLEAIYREIHTYRFAASSAQAGRSFFHLGFTPMFFLHCQSVTNSSKFYICETRVRPEVLTTLGVLIKSPWFSPSRRLPSDGFDPVLNCGMP